MNWRRLLVVAFATVLLATGSSFGAEAAEVRRSTRDSDRRSACAVWHNPSPAPYFYEYVNVCGGYIRDTETDTRLNGDGMHHSEKTSIDNFYLTATRRRCRTREGDCEWWDYGQGGLSEREVSIDVDTGQATLRGVAQGCSIDVVIDAPHEAAGTTGSSRPYFEGVSRSPDGTTQAGTGKWHQQYRSGTARGIACGWGDLMAGRTGEAGVNGSDVDHDRTTVSPTL